MDANIKIPVLFQNQDFVVIDKPEGLNVHSENSAGLVVQLKQQLEADTLYPVHRLDKMTSGLMLFALNKPAAQAFQRLFEAHGVQKYYLAISDQKPKKKQGTIKGDMLQARRGSWKLAKSNDNPAITRFVSVSIKPGERLFLLQPITGRTHQIRVALKSIAAPICGDERYANADAARHEDRGYLHAYAVEFELLGKHYRFVCKPSQGQRFLTPACRLKIEEWQAPWDMFNK